MEDETKPAFGALVATIRSASLAAAQDIPFYKSLDRGFATAVDETGSRLLDLATRLMHSVVADENEIEPLTGLESLNDNWKDVASVLDTLFEKADIALDGRGGEEEKTEKKVLQKLGGGEDKVVKHSKSTEKPQDRFKKAVDNSNESPFKPLLRSKPHALQSLEESMELVQDELVEYDDEEEENEKVSRPHYKHPYEYEIMHQPMPKMEVVDAIKFNDWKSTTFIYVDTVPELKKMLGKLKMASEIAVDLEHHDYRSFHGFVCLMQVSTRDQDWIVDTLVLRDELQVLNEVFADPAIVKVFHGASMDMIWLQRDFGLYVVSLFDTYFAAKALGLKRHGLAHLLEKYADFQTSKQYQLADWRIRPLPQGMLLYARSDTHFLLYCYDRLRNELVDKKLIKSVVDSSKKVATRRYEIPGYDSEDGGLRNIMAKYSMTAQERSILRALYEWRDAVARRDDESPRYVMPNHFLAALCYSKPTTVNEVLGASNGVTGHIRHSAKEIAQIIAVARDTKEVEVSTVKMEKIENVEKLEQNYDAYEREYNKALKSQARLFKAGDSKLLVRGDEEYTTDEETERRRQLASESLNLSVLVPQDQEVESDEEVESDVNSDSSEPSEVNVPSEPNEPSEPQLEEPGSELTSKDKRRKRRKIQAVSKTDEIKTAYEEGEIEARDTSSEFPTFNAFDYTAAPKVLEKKKDASKPKRSFNQHAKFDDGPKGAKRRRQGGGGGRTVTYKKKH